MKHLVWFRNDLRTEDQYALWKATQHAEKVIGVYCLDPRHFALTSYGFPKTGAYRAQFLWDSLRELKRNLDALNIPLWVFYGEPETVIPELAKTHGITTLFTTYEWTSEERKVSEALKVHMPGIVFHELQDGFLFHPEDIPYTSAKEVPEIFTEFRKKCEKLSKIRPLVEPKTMPKSNYESTPELPTLASCGITTQRPDKRTAFPFQGGENNALLRLEDYFYTTENLSQYKQTRNGLIGPDYSSKFSPWLANGCISPRKIYWEVQQYEAEVCKNEDTYWLIFELIWRDYFRYISQKHGNKIFQLNGIVKQKYEWELNARKFEKWTQGKTPEPFVNANMKELAATGFMSNRGRQNVASFWAKEWEQDWRAGAAWFESLLIDYDVHSNYGNWLYNSGVGNDPRDRKFNIRRQAEMYDPKNEYQDLWNT
ncbi:DASH family cryptochrome [Flavobacterium sp.]|jgi:deoxyribodipyrimidine photo-lyase|uniref:DASH family cryptochrome n=1 Tax=Flavobacterium sp. TaxID=239 RepID=UPI0022C9350F|nr:DASH family cryptochrome [Flavobacterium sp.]MCZ8143825.1 DASH family cryptochrome [Flavobacterium sp.]MCZ8367472.1 DASH family cryptochrome [Flavobacterium sp.]